uniref:Pleiotropic regulator 1 n=1 Tax=Macrostomum lignano TaxID=282301 RepID=A0A1I8FVT6_9PLAT
ATTSGPGFSLTAQIEPVQPHSVHTLVFRSLKRTHDMFLSERDCLPAPDPTADQVRRAVKAKDQFGPVLHMQSSAKTARPAAGKQAASSADPGSAASSAAAANTASVQVGEERMLVPKRAPLMPKPDWHPPWKLYRVISGHTGWVRCVAVDPLNRYFVTGAADRLIKIWDLASGTLKLSLTGHISTVRGLQVSDRHPFLFSCSEDKTVRCWDLEENKVVRHYHGHLSAVYGLTLHPTLDLLVTCGRDATARLWDMRTKLCIHTLAGHSSTVAAVASQSAEPQLVTGSHDCTVRLWDIAAGKSLVTLTNHKKSVRALAIHPTQFTFATGAPDNIKQWKFPDGQFLQNFSGHNAIVNALALNEDGVLVSGADNGSLHMWDWRTGSCFQRHTSPVQPGSIDSEAGIFALAFDRSGSRLITAEADKTVKIYKEDETATEETHPVNWRPGLLKKARY